MRQNRNGGRGHFHGTGERQHAHDEQCHQRALVQLPNFYLLQPMPILSVVFFVLLWRDLRNNQRDFRPFFLTLGIFLMNYIGIGVSTWPWLVPFKVSCGMRPLLPSPNP